MRRQIQGSLRACLAAGLASLLLAGCPAKPPLVVNSLATMRAEDLPADPATLAKRAEELYVAGDPASLENGLVVLERLIALQPGAYDPLWQAARMGFAIADAAEKDNARREVFGRRGAKYAKMAIALDKQRIEGHYYLALCLGYVAWSTNVGAFDLLSDIASAGKTAAAMNEAYDYAGPQRLLGMVYLRAPGWPTSIGDPEEALAHLTRAATLAPGYIPNHLYLAEALLVNEKRSEALREIEAAMGLPPPTDPVLIRQMDRWKHDAEVLKKKISDS